MIRAVSFHYHIQTIDNGYILEYHHPDNSYNTKYRHFSKLDTLLKFISKLESGRIKKINKKGDKQ